MHLERRISADDAEVYARRILAAVEYQRQEARRAETARITSIAAGNAVTHDWVAGDHDPRCSRCRTVASFRCIQLGQVPTCGEAQANRCPLGWHAISFHVIPGKGLDYNAGDCMHCYAVYPATAEASTEERAQ